MFRIFLVLLMLPALSLSSGAFAQDMPAAETKSVPSPPLLMLKQQTPAHPERVVLVFHKVAGLEPDFLSWARTSPFLQDTKDIDRDTIVSREDNRLRRAYSELDLSDPLVIHTKIHLDDYSTIQEILHLSEFTPKTFFSFSLYGENVAIVPKGIAQFGTLSIGKSEMDQMLEKAGSGQVTAELFLKPVVADPKTPFMHNHTAYWLLLAEIGEIRFWSNKGQPDLLWMYRADWYKPKENSVLMDLKNQGLQ